MHYCQPKDGDCDGDDDLVPLELWLHLILISFQNHVAVAGESMK